jgi:hypothetical protein
MERMAMGNWRGNRLRRLGREEGQTLVLTMLVLGVLLAMAGVVVDGSNLFVHRQAVQNTADSVALAAAVDLPVGGGTCSGACAATLKTDADTYSSDNGGPALSPCDDSSGPDPNSCYETPYRGDRQRIQVRIVQEPALSFARLFGVDSAHVSASAVAGLSNPTSLGDVAPIGISEKFSCQVTSCMGPSKTLTLDFDQAGDYALLDLDVPPSPSPTAQGNEPSNTMRNYTLCTPCVSGLLPSDAWYAGNNPGQKNGAFNSRPARDALVGLTILIPVFDDVSPANSSSPVSYHVIGFDGFTVTQVDNWNTAKGHQMDGYFTSFVTGDVGGHSSGDCTFGVCTVSLDQ